MYTCIIHINMYSYNVCVYIYFKGSGSSLPMRASALRLILPPACRCLKRSAIL